MFILDSPKYYIVSSNDELPDLACMGSCKRVWWIRDLPMDAPIHRCQWCNGEIESAETSVHYRILDRRVGTFNPDDLSHFTGKKEVVSKLIAESSDSHVTVMIQKE